MRIESTETCFEPADKGSKYLIQDSHSVAKQKSDQFSLYIEGANQGASNSITVAHGDALFVKCSMMLWSFSNLVWQIDAPRRPSKVQRSRRKSRFDHLAIFLQSTPVASLPHPCHQHSARLSLDRLRLCIGKYTMLMTTLRDYFLLCNRMSLKASPFKFSQRHIEFSRPRQWF